MGDILSQLHPLERKLLPFLEKHSAVDDLVKASGMKDIEVIRALQWLTNKNILTIKDETKEFLILDKNGILYLTKGLPERRFLAVLAKEMSLKEIERKADLNKEEVNICLGILKRKAAINIRKGKDIFVSLTDQGKALLAKETLEEKFLKRTFPKEFSSLPAEEQYAYAELAKRKSIIKKETQKHKFIILTEQGRRILKDVNLEEFSDVIGGITPEIIRNKAWKTKKFQSYDVTVRVPKLSYGKKHFETDTINYVRKIFLDMGFEEMSGTLVQTAFWNLDALFVPQDHPAREMQDTFFLKQPATGELPKQLVQKIKKTHEMGGDTGSRGWQSPWNEEKAMQLLLRTQTTALSAQAIAKLRPEDLPKKYFSIGKVFRNETLDWKHLFEFYQVEGIVIDKDVTFGNLLWYLKQFYSKMGYDEVRFKPSHFPYTEPSVEIQTFNEEKGEWVELGGAGVFRPEVVKPLLGIDVPVLAWGNGLGRIMSPYFDIKDLREINQNNLNKLRSIKKWTRL